MYYNFYYILFIHNFVSIYLSDYKRIYKHWNLKIYKRRPSLTFLREVTIRTGYDTLASQSGK